MWHRDEVKGRDDHGGHSDLQEWVREGWEASAGEDRVSGGWVGPRGLVWSLFLLLMCFVLSPTGRWSSPAGARFPGVLEGSRS